LELNAFVGTALGYVFFQQFTKLAIDLELNQLILQSFLFAEANIYLV